MNSIEPLNFSSSHYRKLESIYLNAPVNRDFFPKTTIEIGDSTAVLTMEVTPDLFHAGQSLHGSIYFRLLDDAAYFACASNVTDFFLYTTQFNIQLVRPAKAGIIRSEGHVKVNGRNLFVAESKLTDAKGRLLAFGTGNFMRSHVKLEGLEG